MVTFVMLNRFCLFRKKTLANPALPLLLLTESIKLDGVTNKIKWKMHTCFTFYFKLWRYFLLCVTRYSYPGVSFLFVLHQFLHQQILFFYNFWELYSTFSERKIFVANISFLMDSSKSPRRSPLACNDQNPLSMAKVLLMLPKIYFQLPVYLLFTLLCLTEGKIKMCKWSNKIAR